MVNLSEGDVVISERGDCRRYLWVAVCVGSSAWYSWVVCCVLLILMLLRLVSNASETGEKVILIS